MTGSARLVFFGILALPAGYLVGLLADRIPGERSLLDDLPGIRLTGRYFWAHVLTMVGFLGTAVRFESQPWYLSLPALVFLTSAIALSLIDLDCLRLPDRLVVPTFMVLVVLSSAVLIASSNARQIQYALIGSGMFFGLMFVFHLAFGNRGLGFGDVKLSAILGLMLGLVAPDDLVRVLVLIIWAVLFGFGLSLFLGLGQWITGNRRPYPLGPFLVFGTCIAVVFAVPLLYG